MDTSPKRDTGAVPKAASPPRSSSTGSPGSKLGPFRLKKGSSSPEMKEEKEKKKSKKSKSKSKSNKESETPLESDKPEAEQQQQEGTSPAATPPILKQSKSKASSLVRKLSIGKYKNKTPKSSQSPSPTLEGSPAQSKSDLTVEEDRFSTASSSVGGRFGEDGGGGNAEVIAVTSPPSAPPVSPPLATVEGGGNDVSEPGGADTSTEERVAGENGEPTTSGDSSAPVEDRFLRRQAWLTQNLDKTLTASEAEAIENEAVTPLSTKDQILSITTPLVEKQREEVAEIQKFIEQESGGSAALANIEEEESRLETSEEAVEDEKKDLTATMPAASNTTEGDTVPPRLSQSLGPSMAQQVGEKREHLYKILVIGELGTGKTSIIKRYVHQFFSQHYRATIGVDFALKVLNWDANTIIRLQLWDIAGQERFGNMTRVYYKEAVGAFIVFDVTRAATFEAVVKWKQDLDAKVQLADGSPIPCILLANKCDQQKEGLVNSPAKMDEYCKERGFAAWFETSAKENINIEDAAQCLVNKNDKLIHHSESSKDLDKIALDGKNQRDQKNGKSCAC